MAKTIIERAKELRKVIEKTAETLPDAEAVEVSELFPKWSGNGKEYTQGQRVRFAGFLWKCLQAHTSQADWTPEAAVSLWTRADDPGEEWPEWRQPTGAQDAYAKGDKVSHNDKHWISQIDANVWEPGATGTETLWTEA